MFRRLVLVLIACVAPLLLALSVEAWPASAADSALTDAADAEGSADAAEPCPEGIEDDVGGFEPPVTRAPADPRELISLAPGEAAEPRPPGKVVLTRPPV
jgi:hypothetical protein